MNSTSRICAILHLLLVCTMLNATYLRTFSNCKANFRRTFHINLSKKLSHYQADDVKGLLDAWIRRFELTFQSNETENNMVVASNRAVDEKELIVPLQYSGKSVTEFLRDNLAVTGKAIHRLCNKGCISVNDKPCFQNHHLRVGDQLRISTTTLHLQAIKSVQSVKYQERIASFYSSLCRAALDECHQIRVLYEDDEMAIVYKPSGIHSSPYQHTLKRQLFTLEELLPLLLKPSSVKDDSTDSCRIDDALLFPRACHRLDYRVPGCLVVAKTTKALLSLNEQFADHSITKEYRAIIVGNLSLSAFPPEVVTEVGHNPRGPVWQISTPLSTSNAGDNTTLSVPSTSLLQVLESTACNVYGAMHRVALSPVTGRRHQLRQHCALLGCPILGDDLYHPIGQIPHFTKRMIEIEHIQKSASSEGIEEGIEEDEEVDKQMNTSEEVAAQSNVRKKVGLCLMSVKVAFRHPSTPFDKSAIGKSTGLGEFIDPFHGESAEKMISTSDRANHNNSKQRIVVQVAEIPKYAKIIAKARSGAAWSAQQSSL